jgi:plastocyanin
MLRRNGVAALSAMIALLGLLIFSPVGARPASASSVTVDMKDLAFSPATIQISQGDTVTWTNDEDVMPHDVTSGALGQPDLGQQFGSEILTPGQSFSATFADAGEFVYLCRLHPTMTGVVIVSPS